MFLSLHINYAMTVLYIACTYAQRHCEEIHLKHKHPPIHAFLTHRSLEVEADLGRSGEAGSDSGAHHNLKHVLAMEGALVQLLYHLDPLHGIRLGILKEKKDRPSISEIFTNPHPSQS